MHPSPITNRLTKDEFEANEQPPVLFYLNRTHKSETQKIIISLISQKASFFGFCSAMCWADFTLNFKCVCVWCDFFGFAWIFQHYLMWLCLDSNSWNQMFTRTLTIGFTTQLLRKACTWPSFGLLECFNSTSEVIAKSSSSTISYWPLIDVPNTMEGWFQFLMG